MAHFSSGSSVPALTFNAVPVATEARSALKAGAAVCLVPLLQVHAELSPRRTGGSLNTPAAVCWVV